MNKKNKLKAIVAIVVALAFILPTSAAIVNKTGNNTIVSIDPQIQVVEKGETFTVSVYVEPSELIIGVAFDFLYYDADLIHANSVTEADLFDNFLMFNDGDIDNVNGMITDVFILAEVSDAVSNPGSFVTIEFTAQQQSGISTLNLEGVIVTNTDGDPLPLEVNDGHVQIGQGYALTVTIDGDFGTVTLDPPGGVYTEGTSVELTAVDDQDWKFIEWSGDLTGDENPETIIMNDDKNVTATFTDIDAIPPNTEIILDGTMGENDWYVSVVTVTLVATDDWSGVESTWYRIDSGYWLLYTGPFKVNEEGYHKLEYYSIDHAENKEDINTTEFKNDIILPTTIHNFKGTIGEQGWFISNVTVYLFVADATSGVNYTKYKLDNGEWMNYTNPFNVTGNGEYTLYYYSVDLAGNIESINNVDFKIEYDTVPPETMHEFDGVMGDNGWYTSNVTVMLTAEDDSAGLDYTMYKMDDGEWIRYVAFFVITKDDEHTLYYYSVDKVGNEENVNEIALNIDHTPPTIVLDAENTGDTTWLLTADVSDEISGIDRVDFYVAGEYLGTATESPYEYEVTNPKRGDMAQAIVFDKAGNLKVSKEVVSQSQGMDGWTFIIGWISNVEEAENTITAQAIRLRYIEIAPTGITAGFVNTKSVEFSIHNFLGRRTLRLFGRMSPVIGIVKGGIIIEGE